MKTLHALTAAAAVAFAATSVMAQDTKVAIGISGWTGFGAAHRGDPV